MPEKNTQYQPSLLNQDGTAPNEKVLEDNRNSEAESLLRTKEQIENATAMVKSGEATSLADAARKMFEQGAADKTNDAYTKQ
jgi:hypothetical protein